MNSVQGVSMHAVHAGFLDAGVKDNEVLIFSELIERNDQVAQGGSRQRLAAD